MSDPQLLEIWNMANPMNMSPKMVWAISTGWGLNLIYMRIPEIPRIRNTKARVRLIRFLLFIRFVQSFKENNIKGLMLSNVGNISGSDF